MRGHVFAGTAFASVALVGLIGGLAKVAVAQNEKPGAVVPMFEVDSHFPAMPDHMLLGGVGGATADSHGNVWVFHRPHTLEEGNATENGYMPAPPVLEFSASGKYVQGWGGPSKAGAYEWTNRGGLHSAFAECQSCTAQRRLNGDGRPGSGEHGIAVDANDNVWLTGNGDGDGQILKFTKDGKFLMQVGAFGKGAGSNDPENFGRPAKIWVDPKTNEAYVADGYRNKRVAVLDADSGKMKRYWGAYGNKPDDTPLAAYDPSAPPSQQFRNPVHCVERSNDGLVYVCDRQHDRVQVFRPDGTFVKEAFYAKRTLGSGSAWDIAFSRDPQQRFMFLADGQNNRVRIIVRETLEEITAFGDGGRQPGQFYGVHSIATDSKGNLYTTETYEGKRLQKFVYKGVGSVPRGYEGVLWPRRS